MHSLGPVSFRSLGTGLPSTSKMVIRHETVQFRLAKAVASVKVATKSVFMALPEVLFKGEIFIESTLDKKRRERCKFREPRSFGFIVIMKIIGFYRTL